MCQNPKFGQVLNMAGFSICDQPLQSSRNMPEQRRVLSAEAQTKIFQSGGGFVELRHFDTHSSEKSTRKKGCVGKHFVVFFLDILKTTF